MCPVLLFFEPFHMAGVVILGDVGAADLAYPQLQVAHVVGQKVVGVVHVAVGRPAPQGADTGGAGTSRHVAYATTASAAVTSVMFAVVAGQV